eukprot:scaffold10123_cov117-Isochrysis_galbana.AAC.4
MAPAARSAFEMPRTLVSAIIWSSKMSQPERFTITDGSARAPNSRVSRHERRRSSATRARLYSPAAGGNRRISPMICQQRRDTRPCGKAAARAEEEWPQPEVAGEQCPQAQPGGPHARADQSATDHAEVESINEDVGEADVRAQAGEQRVEGGAAGVARRHKHDLHVHLDQQQQRG